MPFRNMFNWDQIKSITAATTLDAVDLSKYKVFVVYAGGNIVLPSGSATLAEAGPVWVLNETVASGSVVSGNSTFVGGVDTVRIPVSGAALFQCVPYSGDIWHWASVPANDTTSVTATSILATSGMFTSNTEAGVSGVATATKINLGIDFGNAATSGLYGNTVWAGYSGANMFVGNGAFGAAKYSGAYRYIGNGTVTYIASAWITEASGRTLSSGVLPTYALHRTCLYTPVSILGYKSGDVSSGISGLEAWIPQSGTTSGNLWVANGKVVGAAGEAAFLTMSVTYESL